MVPHDFIVTTYFESKTSLCSSQTVVHNPPTYNCSTSSVGGDWNGHLVDPRQYSWVDSELCRVAKSLKDSGYSYFPTSNDIPTYRSAGTKSVIDYVFSRNLDVVSSEIAKVYVAQHRPIVLTFKRAPGWDGELCKLDVALGEIRLL